MGGLVWSICSPAENNMDNQKSRVQFIVGTFDLVWASSRESDTDDHFIQFFLYIHDYNLGYRGPVNYSVMLMVSFYGTADGDGDGDGDGGVCDEEVENLGWELAGYGANVPPLSARPKLEKCWKYGEPEIQKC